MKQHRLPPQSEHGSEPGDAGQRFRALVRASYRPDPLAPSQRNALRTGIDARLAGADDRVQLLLPAWTVAVLMGVAWLGWGVPPETSSATIVGAPDRPWVQEVLLAGEANDVAGLDDQGHLPADYQQLATYLADW
ncbi:MAG: hypothetical protein MJD61_20920 [Proteobacteria bacterium]|nr:hypothetical protein [Pseudomonadota bacterium]